MKERKKVPFFMKHRVVFAILGSRILASQPPRILAVFVSSESQPATHPLPQAAHWGM